MLGRYWVIMTPIGFKIPAFWEKIIDIWGLEGFSAKQDPNTSVERNNRLLWEGGIIGQTRRKNAWYCLQPRLEKSWRVEKKLTYGWQGGSLSLYGIFWDQNHTWLSAKNVEIRLPRSWGPSETSVLIKKWGRDIIGARVAFAFMTPVRIKITIDIWRKKLKKNRYYRRVEKSAPGVPWWSLAT